MNKKATKDALSKEVAIKEVRSFLERFNRRKNFTDDKIEEDYPDLLEAVQLGLVVFDDKKMPTFTLESPVKNDEGEVVVKDVTFKTRIKPSTKADLAHGIDLRKDAAKYSLNVISYIVDQPRAMLDKFEPFDYDVIQQVSSVFS